MFITLEGPDGSGKTSQVKPLVDFLIAQGYPIFAAREPGGTEIGEQVREILMRLDNTAMHPRTETLLFCAARAQLVEEVIKPQLAAGRIVLLDRYADSTLAYQGYGRGLDLATLRLITAFATGGLTPDVTFFLDLPVETGLARKREAWQAKRDELNRMDRQDMAFYHRVRDGYLAMIAQDPARWIVVDAGRGIHEIHHDIVGHVDALLKSASLGR